VTVYVDQMMKTVPSARWPFKASCHLYADTEEELHQFAERLGLERRRFQSREQTGLAHYDLVTTKRRWAIRLGAHGHSTREAARYFAMAREK